MIGARTVIENLISYKEACRVFVLLEVVHDRSIAVRLVLCPRRSIALLMFSAFPAWHYAQLTSLMYVLNESKSTQR